MNWSADHAGFVIASYAVSVIFIAALFAWILRRDRKIRKRLSAFETPRK